MPKSGYSMDWFEYVLAVLIFLAIVGFVWSYFFYSG